MLSFSNKSNHFHLPNTRNTSIEKEKSTLLYRCTIPTRHPRQGWNVADPGLGFCLMNPLKGVTGILPSRPRGRSCVPSGELALVETLAANPRHGEGNEEAPGGAEEEQHRAERDVQDTWRKEQGTARAALAR